MVSKEPSGRGETGTDVVEGSDCTDVVEGSDTVDPAIGGGTEAEDGRKEGAARGNSSGVGEDVGGSGKTWAGFNLSTVTETDLLFFKDLKNFGVTVEDRERTLVGGNEWPLDGIDPKEDVGDLGEGRVDTRALGTVVDDRHRRGRAQDLTKTAAKVRG